MQVEQRHAERAGAFAHARFALGHLAEVEGRRVQHAQHLGAGHLGGLAGFVEPGVFADHEAETEAVDLEHHGALTSVAAGGEIAPLVEHLVVGQFAFAVGRDDAPPREHRGRVVALLHRVRLRPNIAPITELMRMPDHHHQARQIGERARAVRQGVGAGLHEGGSQQQVFGRVAAQAEFGREHEAGALRVGTAGGVDDLRGVAGEVADGGIDLRQGHFHQGLY